MKFNIGDVVIWGKPGPHQPKPLYGCSGVVAEYYDDIFYGVLVRNPPLGTPRGDILFAAEEDLKLAPDQHQSWYVKDNGFEDDCEDEEAEDDQTPVSLAPRSEPENNADEPPPWDVDETQPGKKFDQDKAPIVQGFLAYFPDAIREVANVSKYGREKYQVEYDDKNWRRVYGAQGRYLDAAGRHLIELGSVGDVDESGQLNLAMACWNLLAALQLKLEGDKNA